MYSIVAQLFNVTFWKCFKIGGIILTVTGFFQWILVIDHTRERFLIFCTSIGLMVVCYSRYYIFRREIRMFRRIIILFITIMLLLTRRSNIMTMFIGWEGVGAISFVLIGWFMSREKAISASFYAFIFNRFADFFFLVLLLWEIGGQHSLFYLQITRNASAYNNVSFWVMVIVRVSIWMASRGKSAQFAFHPWLTLAMEGPTPVRSLLHSRTMVVAGVYLLLKLHPLIISLNWIELNNVIIISRALTIIFTSLWAIRQVDIKKIIALSTTSQLRLIMVTCSIGQYDLAFLHILLHGFFKALLFIGSGITIHNNPTGSQDITKLNLLIKKSLFLHTVFIIGVLGLMGAPFVGSFHSKHLILDSTQYAGSLFPFNSILSYIRLYISPIITLGYSIKLLFFISQKPSLVILSSSYISRSINDLKVTVPISVLAICRLRMGSLIRHRMRRGISSSTSNEEVFHLLFFFVLFLGLMYWLLLFQRSLWFLYNLSGSNVKSCFLYVQKLLMLSFFQLVEYLSLKKGLKLIIPSFNLKNEQGFLILNCDGLKGCLSIYLYNLAATILFGLIHFFSIL